MLLELENPEETIEKYLSEVPARISNECGITRPLREVIRTSLISKMREPHIRIVDFGVGTYHSSCHLSGRHLHWLSLLGQTIICRVWFNLQLYEHQKSQSVPIGMLRLISGASVAL